jgi:integrase/recombinase XerD
MLGLEALMGKQAKVLSTKDVKRVLQFISANNHAARNRAIFMCSLLGGMRACEIANLQVVAAIDSDGEVRNEIYLSPLATKGNKGRYVYVSTKLKQEIARYIAAVPPTHSHNKLFYSQKGAIAGFSPNTITQLFGQIYKESGIDKASSHSGRRTFLTALAEKGVNVRVIMQLAGHRSMATTQRYIEANPEMIRRALELV